MSLEQLMAFAARLNSQVASPMGRPLRPERGFATLPRQVSLSAQEWAELFPDSPLPLNPPAPAHSSVPA